MYLSKWPSTIPSMQAAFIESLLATAVDQQNLTPEEATAEADRLLRLLAAGTNRLLTQLRPVEPDELIASEAYNDLVQHLTADLSVAFAEANNLSALLAVYQRLSQGRMIGELRSLVADLEQKVLMLRYLDENQYGFDNIVDLTFQDGAKRSFHSATLDSLLFRDLRSGNILTAIQDCQIDTLGKCLLPAVNAVVVNKLVKAELTSLQLANQLISLDYPGSNLANLIDGRSNSFWAVREVATRASNSGLQVELSLDSGKQATYSYVDLYPLSQFPVLITGLAYEDSAGQQHAIDLSHNNSANQEISSPGRFYFPACRGRRLYLQAQQLSNLPLSAFSLETASAGNLPSLPLPELMAPAPVPTLAQDDLYAEYFLGFDNLKAGTITCGPLGIYVSPEIKVDRCGAVGLEATTEDIGRLAAIEFYVLKRDYSKNGSLLRTSTYPLLPLSQTAIIGEEAVFADASNTTTLRFRAHNAATPTIQVYQEETQLSASSYIFPDNLAVATNTRLNIYPAGNGKRYTIDYVPAHLNGLSPVYLDEQQAAWYMGNNVLYCAKHCNNIAIYRSSLYLIVYFRLRAAQHDVVPRLVSCRLLTGSFQNQG